MSSSANNAQATQRTSKPPPNGPTPPAPESAPSTPPPLVPANGSALKPLTNGTHSPAHNHTQTQKGKKKVDTAVDPQAMYESLKNRIAYLEEELIHADEEEERFVREAQSNVQGLEKNAIYARYIELFADMKRQDRERAKEKQKLTKDKDQAKAQLTKANQAKARLENLAREMTKETKKLREERQQLLSDVAKGLEEIKQLSTELTKGKEKARQQEIRNREQPDIVVKVVCKYRAELFFKISRKTKLSRLFTAWTERMENASATIVRKSGNTSSQAQGSGSTQVNGTASGKGSDASSIHSNSSSNAAYSPPPMSFVYTHLGRSLDPEMTVEEAGIEDADEILAVELMDLTGPAPDDAEEFVEAGREIIIKNWAENPKEAKKAMEEMFDGVTRERLKLVLRQYELRERHFESFVRSKELELLLARYREGEQRQLVEAERSRLDRLEEDNQHLRKELEDAHNGQTLLIEKLIQCCKEPNAERTQRLFTSLRDELEKRGTKLADSPVGG